jgi:phosphoribosylamine--glycine ligase
MRILVIGSGGREHAIVWKLASSPTVREVLCAPGNPGIAAHARLISLKPDDMVKLAEFAERENVDLTVVGPEQPLADGIVDLFVARGLRIFGPTKAASRLEWSKAFAKDFMRRHGIPTAASETFDVSDVARARASLASSSYPVVLKADGLAAGKGVIICQNREEAERALSDMFETRTFGAAGSTVVIEEYLTGTEASVFAVSDGNRYVLLAPAQDHKRVFDEDQGKNTGGMGAFAPTPFVSPALLRDVEESIVRPTLEGMRRDGSPYRGCLYVGLMLTADGPKVIEYNSRFGDPETQVVLPLYGGDLARLLCEAAEGLLSADSTIPAPSGSAVCVVLASGGYPDAYPTGFDIAGIEEASSGRGIIVFHAGTSVKNGRLVTSGGRVLGVTAVVPGGTLPEAIDAAYRAVGKIAFQGVQYRKDIGRKALRRTR